MIVYARLRIWIWIWKSLLYVLGPNICIDFNWRCFIIDCFCDGSEKFCKVQCGKKCLTGAQVAQRILSYAGINDVTVCHISGNLTDHYNPRTKQIGLSDSVYGSNSVAAIAVAAHECGHVIQHANSYVPLSIRTVLVPVANFGSGVSWFFILAGILFSMPVLITAGIVFFSAAVLFQVVTLPVEFNASRRALVILQDTGILGTMETDGAKKVLRAAALTYVASAAAAILQLLRLILLFGRNNRD